MNINMIKAVERAKRLHGRLRTEQGNQRGHKLDPAVIDALRVIKNVCADCIEICEEIRKEGEKNE